MGSREMRPLVTDKNMAEYLAMKAQKKAAKEAKKLKSKSICSGYDNESNPFGDSNLKEIFVWRKKIEHNVSQGVPVLLEDMFSKKRRKERMEEIEKGKRRREEKAAERAKREEDMALLARERARAEFLEWEKKEEDFFSRQSRIQEREGRVLSDSEPQDSVKGVETEMRRAAMKAMGETKEGDSLLEELNMDSEHMLRKPKYMNRVQTGYDWNKYNRVHYDHENPPPRTVKGYKFNIFYPDLIDKTKAPSYTIEKDDSSDSADPETCIIRFHGGPPYEDIAFRIVNKDWEYSQKNGFKCTFERGILQLYFNVKRYRYRK